MKQSKCTTLVCLVLAIIAIALLAPSCVNAKNYLISTGFGGHDKPDYILKNMAFIESRPLDGMMIDTKFGWLLMQDKIISKSEMDKEFGNLTMKSFKKFERCLIKTWWGGGKKETKPVDFFDDWTIITTNYKNLAKLCKERGFAGIFLDNEEYSYNYFEYPKDVKYKNKSMLEYQMQARLRGKQLMQAMVKEYPSIQVLVLHSPSESTAEGKKYTTMWSTTDTLVGAFAAGIIEGASGKAKGIDGGEFYDLNNKEAFDKAFNFCKYGITSKDITAPFMDDKLRKEWPSKFNASYGVYCKQAPDKKNWEWIEWTTIKDLSLLTERLKWALNYADQYVWFYCESFDVYGKPEDIRPGQWNPPALPQDWIDAINKGRQEAKKLGN